MCQGNTDETPTIRNPSIYGTVEITRGCGRGCHFCSPTTGDAYSYPMDYILEEARINAHDGSRMIILQTEDLFLYQSGATFIPNKKAIIKLIREIGGIKGVEFIRIAHMSLPPVVYDPAIVKEMDSFPNVPPSEIFLKPFFQQHFILMSPFDKDGMLVGNALFQTRLLSHQRLGHFN